MASHEEKYLDYSAAYTLGALDGEELSEFTAHLKSGCAICSSEVGILTEMAALLPSALRPLMVSPDLSERVLFNAQLAKVAKAHFEEAPAEAGEPALVEVKEAPKEKRQAGKSAWFSYALGGAILFMLGAFSLYVYRLSLTINDNREFIASQKAQITKLWNDLDRRETVLKVMGSRKIEIVKMAGLRADSAAYGTIFMDPEKKVAVLHIANLPLLPQDRDYQLWVFKEQKKISAGTFSLSEDWERETFYSVTPFDVSDRREIDSIAVTSEPKGGAPQPTGETYLLGKKTGQ